MTIRNRLILSNILMIGIPLLLAALFAAATYHAYGPRYLRPVLEMYDAEEGVYSVQNILYSYRDELARIDVKPPEDGGDDDLKDRVKEAVRSFPELPRMERELAGMGYRFQITVEGEAAWHNLTGEERRYFFKNFNNPFDGRGSLTMGDGRGSVVSNGFKIGGKDCAISAIHLKEGLKEGLKGEEGTAGPRVRSYFERYIVTLGAAFLAFILVTVIATDLVLSGRVSRMILRPLGILNEGTRRIAGGDLDFRLDYEREDEFGAVCREFEAMRARLKASVEERLRYEAYRKDLIVGVSHDLRTPLTSIKGYAEGLRDGIAETEERRQRYCAAIHRRALDMEALVDSLSVLARLEDGRFHYRPERVDVGAWLRQVVQEYRAMEGRLRLSIEDRCPGAVAELDLQEMRRVLVNLFENSARHGGAGNVRVLCRRGDGRIEISVSDDGPGVPEEDLPRLFESFYRADRSRTSPGSGLGLAIARQIVEGHGGTIRAYNDGGLTVVIDLPEADDRLGQ